MSKKLKIELLKSCEALENITKLVANNNSGDINVSLKEIETYLKVRAGVYPTIRSSKGYIGEDGAMIVTDDGLEANIILRYEE